LYLLQFEESPEQNIAISRLHGVYLFMPC